MIDLIDGGKVGVPYWDVLVKNIDVIEIHSNTVDDSDNSPGDDSEDGKDTSSNYKSDAIIIDSDSEYFSTY